MLLTADIGNTTLTAGVFHGTELLCTARISAVQGRTADEYAVLLQGVLQMRGVDPRQIHHAVLASVVKPLNPVIARAVERLAGVRPLFFGPGVRSGLKFQVDAPAQVGADIAASCVGAMTLQTPPFVVVNLGDATTLSVVDRQGSLQGVIICSGVLTGLAHLSSIAAELTEISLEQPRSLLGKNTVDSLNSGAVYGAAAMVEGLVSRLRDQYGEPELPVLATGPRMGAILPYCRLDVRQEPELVLLGLKRVHDLNASRR